MRSDHLNKHARRHPEFDEEQVRQMRYKANQKTRDYKPNQPKTSQQKTAYTVVSSYTVVSAQEESSQRCISEEIPSLDNIITGIALKEEEITVTEED